MEIQRVLVLGATGRIGTILQACWGTDTGSDTGPHMIRWQGRVAPRATLGTGAQRDGDWAVLDPLEDPAALAAAAAGCGAILCLAGVTPARAQRGGGMNDNSALAEAAVRAVAPGARVLLASSAAVYGGQIGGQSGSLAETTAPAPVSEYGRAKAAMETRAGAVGRELGVSVTALRIGNIAGADAILGGWRPGFQLDQFADGRTPRRSYIGPVTLARVLADLLAAPDLPGVLNLAAPGVVEMGALLEAAGQAWTPRPAPASALAEVRLDVRALQRFARLSDRDSLATTLVAEWRALEPEIAGTGPL